MVHLLTEAANEFETTTEAGTTTEAVTGGRRDTSTRRGRRRKRRAALTLVAALALTVGAGGAAVTRLQGNITAADITGALGNRRPAPSASIDPVTHLAPLNILLMGSDSRSELSDGADFGGRLVQGARSDTTLLVHLSADRRSATAVSIPRDSMVAMPSCTDPDADLTGAPVRQFNAAFALGGPGCTVRTVEANTGIRIDHFAVLNFDGFRSMVDALGGVPIDLPRPVTDRKTGLKLPSGTSSLDGEQALAFVRARYDLGDGSDLGRITRQQAFLGAVVDQVTSSGVLLRPDRLLRFLNAATRSLTTDPAWASIVSLTSTAKQVHDLPASGVRFLTVPTRAYAPDPNRVEWTPAAKSLWGSLRLDQRPPAGEGAADVGRRPHDHERGDEQHCQDHGEHHCQRGATRRPLALHRGLVPRARLRFLRAHGRCFAGAVRRRVG
jgi:LCP family protein required for cell wall assembly